MKKVLVLIGIIALTSCSGNQMARQFGGSTTVDLPAGRKLVTVTWKDDADLWILTKEDTSGKPSVYHFKQKSSLGLKEGEVIINETK